MSYELNVQMGNVANIVDLSIKGKVKASNPTTSFREKVDSDELSY
jgi:hypothetical protein